MVIIKIFQLYLKPPHLLHRVFLLKILHLNRHNDSDSATLRPEKKHYIFQFLGVFFASTKL